MLWDQLLISHLNTAFRFLQCYQTYVSNVMRPTFDFSPKYGISFLWGVFFVFAGLLLLSRLPWIVARLLRHREQESWKDLLEIAWRISCLEVTLVLKCIKEESGKLTTPGGGSNPSRSSYIACKGEYILREYLIHFWCDDDISTHTWPRHCLHVNVFCLCIFCWTNIKK